MDLERRTTNVEDAANIIVDITVDSASIIMQGKNSGNREYHQVNSYNKNESNKSNEGNASKTIENRDQSN